MRDRVKKNENDHLKNFQPDVCLCVCELIYWFLFVFILFSCSSGAACSQRTFGGS